MEHISDHSRDAEHVASEVRDLFAGFGVSSDILPAHDRVVIHLPLSDARALVDEAKAVRGCSSRAEWPHAPRLQFEDEAEQLAYAYG